MQQILSSQVTRDEKTSWEEKQVKEQVLDTRLSEILHYFHLQKEYFKRKMMLIVMFFILDTIM